MMNIVVLIKPLPDLSQLKISRSQGQVIETGKRILNSWDRSSMQLAVDLRQTHGGMIHVISLCRAEESDILREAYALGADHCIQLTDAQFAGSDAYVMARILSRAIARLGVFDLILCGAQSDVGFSGQIGPRVAEALNIPQATAVGSISVEGNTVIVSSNLRGKTRTQKLTMPALLTLDKAICTPKIPNALSIMKAFKKEVVIWNVHDLGLLEQEIGVSAALTRVYSQYLAETG